MTVHWGGRGPGHSGRNGKASLTLGPELVVNGDFSSGVGWNPPAGGVIAAGVLTCTAVDGYAYRTDANILAGTTYRVSGVISGYSAGTVKGYVNSTPIETSAFSANGAFTQDIVAGDGTDEFGMHFAGFTGVIDNFSIKAVL